MLPQYLSHDNNLRRDVRKSMLDLVHDLGTVQMEEEIQMQETH